MQHAPPWGLACERRDGYSEIVNPLTPFLERQHFVMLDGGLATEMERKGANLDDPLWSARMLIDSPEIIRLVHSDFLRAGADIIATATYQASFDGFEQAGLTRRQAERLMRLGVDLAVLARETFWSQADSRRERLRPLVAASIGPYGASLHDGSEYHGNYRLDRRALMDFHRPRMEVLADTDADLFAFETIPSLLEAEALLRLLEEFPGKTAWLSFVCRNGREVAHGEPFAECAAMAGESDALVAIGVNCISPLLVSELLECASGCRKPLAVYPNSGETWDGVNQCWSGEGTGTMPVADWYECGARLIGSCCRTTCDDITRMRADLLCHLHGNAHS